MSHRFTAHDRLELATLAEKRGDFVRFQGEENCFGPERIGKPHNLKISPDDFQGVLSVTESIRQRSTILEFRVAKLGLQWWSRSPSRFKSELIMLIDNKAVLGALAKGRTGAPSLRRLSASCGA